MIFEDTSIIACIPDFFPTSISIMASSSPPLPPPPPPPPLNVVSIMPGSLSFDTILPPKLDINAGAKSHFFQPPKTSSASSSLHRTSTTTPSLSTPHVNLNTSRKRSRRDSSDEATPVKSQSYTPPTDSPSPLDHSTFLSPVPFVNSRYRLAGGLDTPTARLTMDEEGEYPTSPDLHVRGFGGFQSSQESYFPQLTSALSREGNGRSRQNPSPRIQHGLGRAVFGMVSVAGKVWDFCRTTAFKVRTFPIYSFFRLGSKLEPQSILRKQEGLCTRKVLSTTRVLILKKSH